jgi:hypothetical protein
MTPNPERRKIPAMKNRFDRGGAAFWILMVLLIVGAWAGYRIGQLYFDHQTLENQIEELGDRAILDRALDVRKEIVKLLLSYDVVMDPTLVEVEFNLNHDRVTVAFNYARSARLGPIRPLFSFRVYAQREAAKAAGMIQGIQRSVEDSNAVPGRRYQEEVKKAFATP